MEELTEIIQQKTKFETDNCPEISSTFKLFDVDEKGYIDFKDLKRIAQELGENIEDSEIKVIFYFNFINLFVKHLNTIFPIIVISNTLFFNF